MIHLSDILSTVTSVMRVGDGLTREVQSLLSSFSASLYL